MPRQRGRRVRPWRRRSRPPRWSIAGRSLGHCCCTASMTRCRQPAKVVLKKNDIGRIRSRGTPTSSKRVFPVGAAEERVRPAGEDQHGARQRAGVGFHCLDGGLGFGGRDGEGRVLRRGGAGGQQEDQQQRAQGRGGAWGVRVAGGGCDADGEGIPDASPKAAQRRLRGSASACYLRGSYWITSRARMVVVRVRKSS